VHFETPITEVSIAQAAALVSLLKAPSSLNRNPEKLRERTVSVLNTMYAKKFITSDQLETAIKETASSFF
jgi:membrane peptidoglycan carboxypeptidase